MSEQPRRPEDGQQEFADVAWSVPSYLLSGILIWGGLGWALSKWTGWAWCTVIGVIIGAALAIYLVYVKYSRLSL